MPGLSATEVDRDGVRGQAVTTEVTIIVSVSLAFQKFLATYKYIMCYVAQLSVCQCV